MQTNLLDPHVQLEMFYIAEYLQSKGYMMRDLQHLPAETAHQLMVEASQYASVKLTNVEMRAGMVHALDAEHLVPD